MHYSKFDRFPYRLTWDQLRLDPSHRAQDPSTAALDVFREFVNPELAFGSHPGEADQVFQAAALLFERLKPLMSQDPRGFTAEYRCIERLIDAAVREAAEWEEDRMDPTDDLMMDLLNEVEDILLAMLRPMVDAILDPERGDRTGAYVTPKLGPGQLGEAYHVVFDAPNTRPVMSSFIGTLISTSEDVVVLRSMVTGFEMRILVKYIRLMQKLETVYERSDS